MSGRLRQVPEVPICIPADREPRPHLLDHLGYDRRFAGIAIHLAITENA